ncbi:DNA-3-methyladenine glycosylase 2 family protein [Methanolobus zinderi]|uniref:DNA-(apurinic or apyrimidinic site) lyase n=2 Tax=Methanolobus zinderi TaxID=536044 RepID=A0A7D5EAE7_9EURY|nr:DNA glycosylase [Methanolobus zinderi]QLC51197.1 DNA-3-methyladenine glycosylase 2 family protein [Methanolobus zinderi]
MYTLFRENFNLEYTLDCGQVFRWDYIDGWWTGVVNGDVVRLQQDPKSGEVLVDSGLPESFFENYFRFDDDLDTILQEVNKDEFMDEAIRKYRGLRLIRQDPWECLISYILATAWSIPNIKRGISMLCKNYGEEIEEGYYSFPDPASLIHACDEDMRACKLGFRGGRVIKAARHVEEGNLVLDDIFKMDYDAAKQRLMFLEGIGEKVADCILLFAFEKMEAFPVDTHVEKVVRTIYGNQDYFNGVVTKSKIGNWGRMYFGRYCGYAQQYFFYQKRQEGLL